VSGEHQPQLGSIQANGISLGFAQWHAELRGREPTLLFVHATGFHSRVWDQLISHLPARHIIAVDQRGHGRSDRTEITGWPVFGRDLAAFVAALELRHWSASATAWAHTRWSRPPRSNPPASSAWR
jgi:lipase